MKAEAEQQQVLAEEPAADRQSLTGDKRGHGPGPASLCSGRSGGMQDAAEAAGSRADACCPARRGTAEEGRAEVSISPGERGRTRPVTAGGAATGLLCASGNFRGERTQNACFLMFRGGVSRPLCGLVSHPATGAAEKLPLQGQELLQHYPPLPACLHLSVRVSYVLQLWDDLYSPHEKAKGELGMHGRGKTPSDGYQTMHIPASRTGKKGLLAWKQPQLNPNLHPSAPLTPKAESQEQTLSGFSPEVHGTS